MNATRCSVSQAAEEGVLVALTGVPAGVADGVVLAALSQLGAVVGKSAAGVRARVPVARPARSAIGLTLWHFD